MLIIVLVGGAGMGRAILVGIYCLVSCFFLEFVGHFWVDMF